MSIGEAQTERALARVGPHVDAITERLARGESLEAALSSFGLTATTINHWRRHKVDGIRGEIVRRIDAAAAAGLSVRRDRLRASMGAVLDLVRAGRSGQAACEEAGVSRHAPNHWRSGVAGCGDLCEWFRREWAEARGASKGTRKAPHEAKPKAERLYKAPVGTVYFIAPVGGGCVKVGFTANPPADRLAALQIGSPVRLEIVATVRAPRSFERWMHEALQDDHSHGEWFSPTARVLLLVRTVTEIGDLVTASPEQMARVRKAARHNLLFAMVSTDAA